MNSIGAREREAEAAAREHRMAPAADGRPHEQTEIDRNHVGGTDAP
jgi:hypothetical protein